MTKKVNPAVHQATFSSLFQLVGEPINNFIVQLKSASPDYEFSCTGLRDLQSFHIKDQLIHVLLDEQLQTDILPAAIQLTSLKDIIRHAEAYKSAQGSQTTPHTSGKVPVARLSLYQQWK